MALVTMPLGSLGASGTIAKSLTFVRSRGRQYVRAYTPQRNPKTASQVGYRSGFGFVARAASSLTEEERAAWINTARDSGLTARNVMIGAGQGNAGENRPPRRSPLDPDTALPDAAILSAILAFRGSVHAAWIAGMIVPDFTWQIYRSTESGFSPNTGNRIAVVPSDQLTYFDGFARFTGAVYYVVAGGTKAAQLGAFSNEVEVIIQ